MFLIFNLSCIQKGRALSSLKCTNFRCIHISMICISEEQIEFIRKLEDLVVNQLPCSATFECEVSKSNVAVQWFKEDEPIRRGHKYDVIADGRVHKLVVKDIGEKDEKEFFITAKNSKCSATLAIKG